MGKIVVAFSEYLNFMYVNFFLQALHKVGIARCSCRKREGTLTNLRALAQLMSLWCSTLYLLRSNSVRPRLGQIGLFLAD